MRKTEPRFSWSLTPSSTATVRAPSSTCGTVSSGGARRRRQHPAVEMESDHLGHHLGGRPVVRRVERRRGRRRVRPVAVGAQQRARDEPRRQHALHHQHTLGDHQPLAGGQVRPAVHAVEVAEVVQPGVGGVGDVDYVGAHALSSTMADIRSAAISRRLALRPASSRASRCFEPLLAGAALGLDQVGARGRHRHQHLTAVAGVRRARDQAQFGQRGDDAASSTAAAPARARLTHPASSRPPWQASTAPTTVTAKPGIPARRNRNWRARRTTASERSLASRPSMSFTKQRIPRRSPRKLTVIGYVWPMTADPPAGPQPPALPAALLAPWPVIVVITAGWLIATVLAFTVPGLHDWRPVTRRRSRCRRPWHVDLSVATSRRAPRIPRRTKRTGLIDQARRTQWQRRCCKLRSTSMPRSSKVWALVSDLSGCRSGVRSAA